MSSQAKLRVQAGMIDNAVITRVEDGYVIIFAGANSDWNGENLILCSAREPYLPRIFKSIDGAVSEAERIGVKGIALDLP
ncbi:hypothetical protein I4548_33270 [Klebsiella michiganensis]|nr:hypothetical protein [Salmonella enterica subsp. enterica serovar Alachua]ECH1978491.1 hypothetical protein [Salmonella enterica]EDV9196783.1 hypothetical protein [Salmonella enterica subsp. enterica serovar Bredeney]EEN6759593.1 hypothetical protein [Salmonella enterica subsp. enterica serovar Adelaide]EEQ0441322.1 hypothetical protein [Salmonella enterica subsp. enterica serovar Cerro]EGT5696554.1 hypothetical protein [Cronobacter sakazakii]MBG2641666.1 hypothetical protein [Klebsiella m